MDNISYDFLLQDMNLDRDKLDEIVDLMLKTICMVRKTIRIAEDDYSTEHVKSKFMKLDSKHSIYTLFKIAKNLFSILYL